MIPSFTIDESTLLHEEFFSAKVPLFLPPPTYGRMDKPAAYLYKKEHISFRFDSVSLYTKVLTPPQPVSLKGILRGNF